MIRLLIWIGLTRRYEHGPKKGKLFCPFSMWPHSHWSFILHEGWFALLLNRSGVIKRIPGRLLPRRWGLRFLVFEFGDRGG